MRTKEEALLALRPNDPKAFTEVQKQAMLRFQVAVEEFAHALYENVPESADRTAAARKLLECKMTGVQAITHVGFTPETKETKSANQNQKTQKSH